MTSPAVHGLWVATGRRVPLRRPGSRQRIHLDPIVVAGRAAEGDPLHPLAPDDGHRSNQVGQSLLQGGEAHGPAARLVRFGKGNVERLFQGLKVAP